MSVKATPYKMENFGRSCRQHDDRNHVNQVKSSDPGTRARKNKKNFLKSIVGRDRGAPWHRWPDYLKDTLVEMPVRELLQEVR